jgi:ABC-type glycerol-3-phosphate transport system permease component
MKKTFFQKIIPYIFIAPTIISLFIFSYYAIFLAFKSSFQNVRMGFDSTWNGFGNYINILHDQVFFASLIHQILFTLSAIFFSIFFPLLAAELLFFIRHKKIADVIKTAFIIPMLVPGIVTILIWKYLYNPIFGLNTILQSVGLGNLVQDWLGNSNTAIWCVIIIGFPFVSGLYFLIFHAGLNNIGTELHEAAIIDGASSLQIVRKIHIPNIIQYINVVFTLTLIGSLSGFGLVAATTVGGPGYSSMIPALYMYNIAFGDGNMGYASAIGVILFIIIIILTVATRVLFKKRNYGLGYWISRLIILILLITTFFPFVMLLNMSLKSSIFIQLDFLGLPNPIHLGNYVNAFSFILRSILNSLFVCGVSLVFILLFVSMSGYAFGRLNFKGKKFFYGFILAVLMIPYTLLIVPNFWIIYKMGFFNSYMALILPYIAGLQVFAIMLTKTYFETLPIDMFEAAKIDGAGEFYLYTKIAIPLSAPIMITVGVTVVIAMYNDYIWPTIVLSGNDDLKTFCQIVFNSAAGNGSMDYGLLAAAFVIGTIPLLVITCSCLKYYLQGMIEGAVKG